MDNKRIYRYYVANLRAIERAIASTSKNAREAISKSDYENSLQTLLRLLAFLVAVWAECRFRKLLYERGGFTDSQRNEITSKETQLDKWLHAIDLAFRKHSGIKKAKLNRNNMGINLYSRREVLREALQEDLKVIIEIRNKLAHGQWIYPFNNDGSINQQMYRNINEENLLSLKLKYNIVRDLANIVHDLIVSADTFNRDFENHFSKLEQGRVNLQRRSYDKYRQQLENRQLISKKYKRIASNINGKN